MSYGGTPGHGHKRITHSLTQGFAGIGESLTHEVAATSPKLGFGGPAQYALLGVQAGRVAWPFKDTQDAGVPALCADSFFSRRINNPGSSGPVTGTPTISHNQNAKTEDGLAMLGDAFNRGGCEADTQLLKQHEQWEPVYGKDVPDGIDGLLVRGAEPGQFTNNVFLPCWNNMLVAHHNADEPPKWSTDVHDIQGKALDQVRKAGLHGPFWVKGLADSECAGTKIFDWQVAFNFTRANGAERFGSHAGFGLATFLGKSEPPSAPITGRWAGRRVIPFAANNQPQPQIQASPSGKHTLAYLSYDTMYGPLWCGHEGDDKHRFGFNIDGEAVNSGHIHVGAYFYRNKREDAPLEFGGDYEEPTRGRHPFVVELRYDPKQKHAWKCGEKEGLWRWETWLPETVVTPGDDRNDDQKATDEIRIRGGGVVRHVPFPDGSPVRVTGFEPEFRWSTLEQQIPSIFPMPRPCILSGALPVDGIEDRDWMRSPRVGHWIATGKLTVTSPVAGKSGVDACPPDYTNRPIGDNLRSHTPGTSAGVQWFASPEMKDHILRHDVLSTDLPTLSTTWLALYGTSTKLGIGCKAASDLGSPVDGWQVYKDGSGDLNFDSVDTAGVATAKALKINGTAVQEEIDDAGSPDTGDITGYDTSTGKKTRFISMNWDSATSTFQGKSSLSAFKIGFKRLATATPGNPMSILGQSGGTSGNQNGGTLLVQAGNAYGTATGGALTLQGGDGNGSTLSDGGKVRIQGGIGYGVGNGGIVEIYGGTPGTGSAGGLDLRGGNSGGSNTGGTVSIASGTGGGSGAAGGAMTITGGNGGGNGNGGALTIRSGTGNGTGTGGTATYTAGAGGTSNSTGGAVAIVGGTGGTTNGAGGALSIDGGTGSGSGNGGAVSINGGATTSGTVGTVTLCGTRGALQLSRSGGTLGFFGATASAVQTGWTTSNVTTDRVLDANSTTLDEVADVLCTLIEDLKTKGLISA